ncbi:MAG: nucleotidyltransferase domain-containing protein [Chloroflexi bacterium]|nr:nucleotidyltransferase domain-containing protein [Chloroflexota bacterium]
MTREKRNALYRAAAEEFARRVVAALGDKVDSIVLYGSAARRQARKDSDVDILVLARPTIALEDKTSDIAYDLMWNGDFLVFISLMRLSRSRFLEYARLRYPFAQNILREGVILYDRGAFSRIREEAVPGGRRSLERRQIPVSGRTA